MDRDELNNTDIQRGVQTFLSFFKDRGMSLSSDQECLVTRAFDQSLTTILKRPLSFDTPLLLL